MAYKLEILPLDEKNRARRERQMVKNPKDYIVFVHGICHGAWCWENFIDFFAEQGYQCYAVSLRGHGNSEGKENLNSFTLSDYVEDVKTVVDMCATKPFLVGHSMGGAVVQQYIGKYSNTVQGAVLFAPATAPKMKHRDILPLKLNLIFATLIALERKFIFSKEFLAQHAAFFTGRDKNGGKVQRVKDTSAYSRLLQPESKEILGGFIRAGDLDKADYSDNYAVDIPVFVIGSYADQYFQQESLEQTASAYASNKKTALVILKCLCHDMMLDDFEPEAWKASAAPVLAFMEDPLGFVDNPKNHWPRK
ncbi:MAG: alpha/beta hydrolase [Oscillibacter sp.]|nr:alpha/beta hydrolase [Oscillibacter sp.]